MGVLVLTLSNLAAKIIGVMFKIPLVGIMGDEGMGYFNSAYTVYTLFYTISTAGLPVALSILISETVAKKSHADKGRVYSTAFGFFALLGAFFTFIMSVFSRKLGEFIGNPDAAVSILAISPVIFFVCLTGARRGYFQGHQRMMPTAVSQLVQSFGKLIFGIAFSLYAVKRSMSYPLVAAYAIFGITLSEALCTVSVMLFGKKEQRDKKADRESECTITRKDALSRIIKTALPISLSASVISLTGMLDLSIVMTRLTDIGYSYETANAMFGNYTGLAVPLFNLPASLITPISLSIVPYITSSLTKNDRELGVSTLRSAVKSSLIISIPCAVGMSVLSKPILMLIFDDAQALRAAQNLSVLSAAVVGVALTSVTTAILQAYKMSVFPVVSILIGCGAKLVSGWVLIGCFGMIGTPISTVICYTLIAALNLGYIVIKLGNVFKIFDGFLKPLLCGAACGAAAHFSYSYMSRSGMENTASCILSIAFAGALYVLSGALLSLVNREDAKLIPGGKYMEKFLK